MVVAEIATGYTALKSAYEIARGLKDINDRVALNAAVIDLQEKILSAQEAASDAKSRMQEMQRTIDAHDEWTTVASRYSLKDFGCQTYAYQAKAESLGDDPPHLACPNCFREHRLAILQYADTYYSKKQFKCLACDKTVDLGCVQRERTSHTADSDFDVFRT